MMALIAEIGVEKLRSQTIKKGGTLKFKIVFSFNTKTKRMAHLIAPNGNGIRNIVINRNKINEGEIEMTKAELNNLTKSEINNVLGQKYTEVALKNIRKDRLIEELIDLNAEKIKTSKKSKSTPKVNPDVQASIKKVLEIITKDFPESEAKIVQSNGIDHAVRFKVSKYKSIIKVNKSGFILYQSGQKIKYTDAAETSSKINQLVKE